MALFLACIVLLLGALAACPDLHGMIHHDAANSSHQCTVTLFTHGQVDFSVVEVAATIPAAPVEFRPRVSVSIFGVLFEPFPPGRGPPGSLLPA